MMTPRCPIRLPRQSRGFTLIELLVVITIIVLVSASMIPVVMPAINERRVSEAANLVHAELNRARDAAVRANAPRGIRLLPDEFDSSRPLVLTSSRLVAIQPGPDYSEGMVTRIDTVDAISKTYLNVNVPPVSANPNNYFGHPFTHLNGDGTLNRTNVIKEYKSDNTYEIPTNPTSWFWNIRQGDQISFGDSTRRYTIVGPVVVTGTDNPQRFINNGFPQDYRTGPGQRNAEFLVLLDQEDNNENGFTDEPEEFEWEQIWEDIPHNGGMSYTIYRRPVPTEDGREVTLPAGTVIDLTTWNATHPERSHLPVDPNTGYVDILIAPNGQVIQSDPSGNAAPPANLPYFHFWITDVEDVHNPLWGPTVPTNPNSAFPMQVPNANPRHNGTGCPQPYLLPMPSEVSTQITGCTPSSYPPDELPSAPFLKANRRLVSLNTMSGQLITSKAENFSIFNTNRPYQDALGGYGESP